jgi:ABC-type multidrug transport system permease subunit
VSLPPGIAAFFVVRDVDRSAYIAFVVPGLLLMTIGSTTIGTAVSVSNDMTEGIIARFRTMAIHRGSVLIGHVIGSVLQAVISVVLAGAVGVAIGFRSTGNGWLAVAWCLGPAVLGYFWSASKFDDDPKQPSGPTPRASRPWPLGQRPARQGRNAPPHAPANP